MGGWNGSGTAADVQRLPFATYGDEAAIASHSTQRFRGYAEFGTMLS